jgi:enoyl-CoA hydratase/carnithine racemase
MDYTTIRYEVDQAIATITFDRPEKMNTLDTLMKNELIDALDRVDADDAVRVVVVTGAGKAFCAGADISGGADGFFDAEGGSIRKADGSLDYASPAARDSGGELGLRIFALKKPIIGAINGAAVGVGVTMTLPMDIRLASEKARFGFVFTRRGIVPECASTWFLPRVVGISRALQWCYSGEVFPAAEALAGGLVSQVLPADELLPAAYAIARGIAENTAPVSIALTRQMMWRGLGLDDPMEAHKIESRSVLSRTLSADATEGVASFLEKRPAVFPLKVSQDMPDFFPWWTERPYG